MSRPQASGLRLQASGSRVQASGLRVQASALRVQASGAAAALIALVLCFLVPANASAQELFRFHSGFWMNLHHYLHALVRPTDTLVETLPATATDEEREHWAAALDFYRTRFAKRRLVFDESLVTIKQQLIAADSGGSSPDALGVLSGPTAQVHRQVLERAAPVYRKYRWSEHDTANRTFMASAQSLIAKHGDSIAARLARSYDATWPAGGIRVDVVRDAGPPGNAYTTNVPPPTHITIGAQDHGVTALELIFHEASHHWDQRLMRDVDDAARTLGRRAPPNLWHALLFYNAGRITADALAAAGQGDYVLMMTEGRIFDAPGWHATIARHWPDFLAATISRPEAILRILRDLSAP